MGILCEPKDPQCCRCNVLCVCFICNIDNIGWMFVPNANSPNCLFWCFSFNVFFFLDENEYGKMWMCLNGFHLMYKCIVRCIEEKAHFSFYKQCQFVLISITPFWSLNPFHYLLLFFFHLSSFVSFRLFVLTLTSPHQLSININKKIIKIKL